MIYFLFNNNDLVYVGKTEDIKQRLRAHRENKQFDSYACLLTDDDAMQEILYINLYKPALNKRTLNVKQLIKCKNLLSQ